MKAPPAETLPQAAWRMLEYTRTAEDDLRRHLVSKEDVDACQWILKISAHTQRHILQIRAIKANPSFPKK